MPVFVFVFMLMVMMMLMMMFMFVPRLADRMEFRRLALDQHPHIFSANPVFRDVRDLDGKFLRRQDLFELPDKMRLRQSRLHGELHLEYGIRNLQAARKRY